MTTAFRTMLYAAVDFSAQIQQLLTRFVCAI
jgi:hypothetical protein